MKGALTGVTRLSSKAKCAILLLGLMVLGFIVFSMASMDQNAHSVDSTARVAQTVQQERRLHRPSPRLKKCSGMRLLAGFRRRKMRPLQRLHLTIHHKSSL